MRLQFDEDDEDQYFETRDELLDEIESSLLADRRSPSEDADVVGSIAVLLDWRWNYSSGQLDDWSRGDVDDRRHWSRAQVAGALAANDALEAIEDLIG